MARLREHHKDKFNRGEKTKNHHKKRSKTKSTNVDAIVNTSIISTVVPRVERKKDHDIRHSPLKVTKRTHVRKFSPSTKDEPCIRAIRSPAPCSISKWRTWNLQKKAAGTAVIAENKKLARILQKLAKSMHPMFDSNLFDRKNWFLGPLRIGYLQPSTHTAPEPITETASLSVTEVRKAIKAAKKVEEPKRSLRESTVRIPVIEAVDFPVTETAKIETTSKISKKRKRSVSDQITPGPVIETAPIPITKTSKAVKSAKKSKPIILIPITTPPKPAIETASVPVNETTTTVKVPRKTQKLKRPLNEPIVDESQQTLSPFFTMSNPRPRLPTPKSSTPSSTSSQQTLSPYITRSTPRQNSPISRRVTTPPIPKPKATAKKPLQPKMSPFFLEPFSAHLTPKGLCFELQPRGYGLIQERIRGNLFALVVQTMLYNKTKNEACRPVLFKLLCAYPAPEDLAVAQHEDVLTIVRCLGLQNTRTNNLIKMAQKWVQSPPDPSRRYYRRDYPKKGSNLCPGTKDRQLLEISDERPGWEIGHLPGVGEYAIDSYRIFYRDTLWGIEGGDGVEPEWKRVVPADKELAPYMAWRWAQEGFDYDIKTGQTRRFIDRLRFESSELDGPSIRRTRKLSTMSVSSGRTFIG
jgi:methyl-CpG-binding domain protein 4